MKLDDTIRNEYAQLQEKTTKELAVQETDSLLQIVKFYEQLPLILDSVVTNNDLFTLSEFYDSLIKELNENKFSYSANDITTFSTIFTRLPLQNAANSPAYLGLFITSLINFHYANYIHPAKPQENIQEPTYLLLFPKSLALDFVGYKNCAKVTIKGDVGSHFGTEMMKGVLHLHGKANYIGPNIYGGEIHVDSVKNSHISQMFGRLFVNGKEIHQVKRK